MVAKREAGDSGRLAVITTATADLARVGRRSAADQRDELQSPRSPREGPAGRSRPSEPSPTHAGSTGMARDGSIAWWQGATRHAHPGRVTESLGKGEKVVNKVLSPYNQWVGQSGFASLIVCLSEDLEVSATPEGQLHDRRGKVGGTPHSCTGSRGTVCQEAPDVRHRRRLAEPEPPPRRLSRQEERAILRQAAGLLPYTRR
jgi:hypothetical protein